jgi:beta-barrel assembly-enhancing protease
MALVVAAFSLFTYFASTSYNPVTEEKQHIDISPQQEIALGLQAAPKMAAEYGGLSTDQQAQALVDQIGSHIVNSSAAKGLDYKYDFHVLADRDTVNAFALPGGQIFITEALASKLKTKGQLAAVLGHEIGHVVARHSAEHLAKSKLAEGLSGAAVIATYDPDNPASRNSAAIAAAVSQLVTMRYGRQDELESDRLGVRFVSEAGYDPRGMLTVMKVLAESGGGRRPEFFSTHPNPENRIEQIQVAIAQRFPNGVPSDLEL